MYEGFFGLREPAFSLTPDPRFLWLSETHEEGLASLYYGIRRRRGFLLLTGEVGTGKTTLLRSALDDLPPSTEVAVVFNTAGLGPVDLFKLIATDLRLPGPLVEKSDYLIALNAYLLERLRSGGDTVLIIDEAQNLSDETLEEVRLLSNLETDSDKLLQIILTGQPELRAKLSQPSLRSLRQRIAIEHHVEPLRREQVRPYLTHRIEIAGGTYDEVFGPGVDECFYTTTLGCPRLMNLLADRALLAAYAKELRPVPLALVEQKAKQMEGLAGGARLRPDGALMGEISDALRRARREGGIVPPDAEHAAAPEPARRRATLPEPPLAARRVASAAPSRETVAISRERTGFWQPRAMLMPDQGALAERYRHLAVRLKRELKARGGQVLLVASPLRNDGKTVTSCNLASALASVTKELRVALVDLDLRRPSTARGLGLQPELGLEDALSGVCSLEDVCLPTDAEGLDVYPVARPVADAHALLSTSRLSELFAELRRSYGVVVCDCPPVLLVPDVALIGNQADSALLVARAGVSRKKALDEAIGVLQGVELLGVVLNDVRRGRQADRYDDYYAVDQGDADEDPEEGDR